ncbi:D-aminoacyl-tRNA deacylase [Chryseobacterium sp. ZHDP1]|uniref:D-aminoacyl-tRNA deacylase n=1 Tax=Chryseobacterium sp. ZHDP1 TaxID=2838877 RepID=UPI001BE0C0F8|nr:D-aminoacyl-tRNA deacylase [Chryseobacterium sp. ZHDP1]
MNGENGHLEKSLFETNGDILIISNFTLYADIKKVKYDFTKAGKSDIAKCL